jgi:hypothetical protein
LFISQLFLTNFLLQILKGIDMGLKNKNIGLIGTGKMGSSLIRGILKSNIVDSRLKIYKMNWGLMYPMIINKQS